MGLNPGGPTPEAVWATTRTAASKGVPAQTWSPRGGGLDGTVCKASHNIEARFSQEIIFTLVLIWEPFKPHSYFHGVVLTHTRVSRVAAGKGSHWNL